MHRNFIKRVLRFNGLGEEALRGWRYLKIMGVY